MAEKITLPPVLERYELKYLIPMSYVEPITQFLAPYCQLDYFSTQAKDEDYFYRVNSLYFDTRNYEFLKQRLWGRDSRFNMRVRTYGEGNEPPYFMEIKHKTGTFVKKYRATIQGEEWPSILTDAQFRLAETEVGSNRQNKDLFMRLAVAYAIEPKIYTQYIRRAFFSTVDEYARVTMDRDMKYRPQDLFHSAGDPYNLLPDGTLINYDNETVYAKYTWSQGSVILELKCYVGQVPTWMVDLITFFELKQESFSKYVTSSLVAHYDNDIGYLTESRPTWSYGDDED